MNTKFKYEIEPHSREELKSYMRHSNIHIEASNDNTTHINITLPSGECVVVYIIPDIAGGPVLKLITEESE